MDSVVGLEPEEHTPAITESSGPRPRYSLHDACAILLYLFVALFDTEALFFTTPNVNTSGRALLLVLLHWCTVAYACWLPNSLYPVTYFSIYALNSDIMRDHLKVRYNFLRGTLPNEISMVSTLNGTFELASRLANGSYFVISLNYANESGVLKTIEDHGTVLAKYRTYYLANHSQRVLQLLENFTHTQLSTPVDMMPEGTVTVMMICSVPTLLAVLMVNEHRKLALRSIKRENLLADLADAGNELDHLRGRLDDIVVQVGPHKAQLEDLRLHISQLETGTRADTDPELSRLTLELRELSAHLECLESQGADLRRDFDTKSQQLSTIQTDITRLRVN